MPPTSHLHFFEVFWRHRPEGLDHCRPHLVWTEREGKEVPIEFIFEWRDQVPADEHRDRPRAHDLGSRIQKFARGVRSVFASSGRRARSLLSL